jgi:hypothetical protein
MDEEWRDEEWELVAPRKAALSPQEQRYLKKDRYLYISKSILFLYAG